MIFDKKCIQLDGATCSAINNDEKMEVKLKTLAELDQKFRKIKEKCSKSKLSVLELQKYIVERKSKANSYLLWSKCGEYLKVLRTFAPLVVISAVAVGLLFVLNGKLSEHGCAVWNNFVIMELSRPATNCDMCKDVTDVLVFHNVTKENFSKYAYSSRPMLVTGATTNWLALQTFSLEFFRKIYEENAGAYESVEEECQFFPFRTKFLSLKEALNMPSSRASMDSENEELWYIGWSNCNPSIGKILRKHYQHPHFLPDSSERSVLDWIFMGWSGRGTSMHLDYVQRPSWQAQISGTKTWNILPSPECELVCWPMNVTVHSGDIFLMDTNQWYHETFIHPGAISITIGSEYD